MSSRFLPFLAASLAIPAAHAQIPAFPGAEGYGGFAKGGRGGDVYVVTNLNASGAGSFADAISNIPGAGRTIVFAVSGYIRLPSGSGGVRMTGSKVTIAGQTAPGDGIGFYNNAFRISGDDVVLRHLRFRLGKNGTPGDCLNLDSGSNNSILDHLSVQFSTDENISSFSSPPENVTLQYSLNAWGLNPHSCGGLWDQNHATAHHNLWAHNHTRNPKARPAGLLEWINNVTFDWNIGFIMGDSQTPAPWKSNVIGNYFLSPPGNLRSRALEKALVDRNGNPNFSVYLSNNRHDNDGDGILNGTDKGYAIVAGSEFTPGDPPGANRYVKSATPFSNAGAIPVTTDDPALAFKKIVSKGGALRLDIDPARPLRDEVDTRLIQNLVTQTPNHITRESDLAGVGNAGMGTLNSTAAPVDSDKDGMPDFYEIALGWNAAAQDHNTALPNSGGFLTGATFMPAGTVSGYTRLEEYLHYKAIPHGTVAKNTAAEPTSVQVDLRKFTSGFSASPVFAVSNITGGGVALGGPGNAIATFTPTLNHVGRARFDFTVTDSAGHSWTQTCAIVVTSAGLPRDLKWVGGQASNAWDGATPNWSRNGAATTFSFGDRVSFDDTGSKSPAIDVPGTVSPGTVDFDADGNYATAGVGSIASSGALTKRGTGTLTLGNTGGNSFSSVTLESGALTLGNNASLGGAPLRIEGGTLHMGSTTPGSAVTVAGPAIITGGNGGGTHGLGAVSGSAPLTIQQTNTFDLEGDMSGYSGTVTFTGNSAVRLFGSTASAAATFHLGNGTTNLVKRSNVTAPIPLGALAGGTNTVLSGANGSGNTTATTYQVGGNGGSTVFSGSIANGGGITNITKVGGGTLTLGGANTYTGATAVNAGGLLIDGSLGNTAVTVAGGALLGGGGTLGGSVTANAGAFLSPGTAPFTGATMTVGGGLTMNAATMYCDMSATPAGPNDKIVVNGTLALNGTQHFQFLLLQGTLDAGTYDLITATNSSVSNVGLTHNLPTHSRQTFALARSAAGSNPSKVWLTVTGNPATLTWTGASTANWDTAAANWTGASPNTFYPNDAVVFDDSTTVNAVTIPAAVAPRAVTFHNATRAYTIHGPDQTTAAITSGALVKNGAALLTFTGTNTPASTVIGAGATIAFANDIANAGALGSGPVTLNGGTIAMYDNTSGFSSSTMNLVVPAGQTGAIHADSRHTLRGTLTGGGTLNFRVPWIRTDLDADWSAFTGTLNVTTDADGGDFRMTTNYSFPGFPLARVNLADRVTAYFTGILAQGAGTTIEIGELSGGPLSSLLGGPTGGRNFTYRIGGRTPAGSEVAFAGGIGEQNSASTTSIVKTGAGTWTLGGTGTWNGGTQIEQGTLQLTGTFACASATNVSALAKLGLSGGSLSTETLNIAANATLAGHGSLTADLVASGAIEGRGFATGTPGTLAVQGSAYLADTSVCRLRAGSASDLIAVSGDLALGGTLHIGLAPGTGFGRYPLLTCGGALSGSAVLTGIPPSTTAHLSTTTPGEVSLVIDDSDEDGLPDSWEMTHFKNLGQDPADDFDGDGTSNLAELRLGLDPTSASSVFQATLAGHTLTWPSAQGIVFTVKRSLTLDGGWTTVATITGGTGNTASFHDPDSFDAAFYQVRFTP